MPSTATVYRWELFKLRHQKRTYLGLGASIIVPILFVLAIHFRHHSRGGDFAFSSYLDRSGLAVPLVILLFGAVWMFPLITALVINEPALRSGSGSSPNVARSGEGFTGIASFLVRGRRGSAFPLPRRRGLWKRRSAAHPRTKSLNPQHQPCATPPSHWQGKANRKPSQIGTGEAQTDQSHAGPDRISKRRIRQKSVQLQGQMQTARMYLQWNNKAFSVPLNRVWTTDGSGSKAASHALYIRL